MAPRNRRLFVLAIAITLFIGVLTSFGLPFAAQTPQIVLSDGQGGPDGTQTPGEYDPDGAFVPVTVTTDTVQAVVASLERSNVYYRSITIERWGSYESADVSSIQVWKHDQFERVSARAPDGNTQNRLTDGTTIHRWYSGERRYHSYPVNANQEQLDLSVELPTYELVAELDPAKITAASYDLKNDINCIYVECEGSIPGWTRRLWVSTETGLLIAAEDENADGVLKYRMTETAYDADEENVLSQNRFSLPDGTRLN